MQKHTFAQMKDKIRNFNEGVNLVEFYEYLESNYKKATNKQSYGRCLNAIEKFIRKYQIPDNTQIVYVEDVINYCYSRGSLGSGYGQKTLIVLIQMLVQYKEFKKINSVQL